MVPNEAYCIYGSFVYERWPRWMKGIDDTCIKWNSFKVCETWLGWTKHWRDDNGHPTLMGLVWDDWLCCIITLSLSSTLVWDILS